VTAAVETENSRAQMMDDAADDPAIWVHPQQPGQSLIFGSNKMGGLAAYDLSGREVEYYPIGKINNVDILYRVPFRGNTISLLGCSNRTDQSVDLFSIDPATGALTDVAAGPLAMDSTVIDDIYGFCLGRNQSTNQVYVIINGKNGRMLQYLLVEQKEGFGLELIRDIAFPSQTEGMVADNELGWLYVGEEAAGVWKLPLDPSKDEKLIGDGAQVQKAIPAATVSQNENIVADVEGIALIKTGPKQGYLVVSVQGNFSYAVFNRAGDNEYLGSFKIEDGDVIDGVEETDGLEVIPDSLSPQFPGGLLVVQDGFNYQADTLIPQNFKLVDWRQVIEALSMDH
jgi:3-phytase